MTRPRRKLEIFGEYRPLRQEVLVPGDPSKSDLSGTLEGSQRRNDQQETKPGHIDDKLPKLSSFEEYELHKQEPERKHDCRLFCQCRPNSEDDNGRNPELRICSTKPRKRSRREEHEHRGLGFKTLADVGHRLRLDGMNEKECTCYRGGEPSLRDFTHQPEQRSRRKGVNENIPEPVIKSFAPWQYRSDEKENLAVQPERRVSQRASAPPHCFGDSQYIRVIEM